MDSLAMTASELERDKPLEMNQTEEEVKKAEPEPNLVETALKKKEDCLELKESKKDFKGEQQGFPKNMKIDSSIQEKEVIAPGKSVEKKDDKVPSSSNAPSRPSGQGSRKRKRSPIDVYSVKPNAEGKYIFPWNMIEQHSDDSSGEEEDDGVDEEHAYNYREY